MKTAHLFAGAGGGLLADLILGHEPVLAVENNPYACEILRTRTPEWLPGLSVHEGDIREFDPSDWQGRVDSVHAGWPCQDISVAGAGAGIKGSQSGLWSEVVRVAGILRPRELFLENSPAIVARGLGTVLGDLAELGYDAKWIVLGAAAVGAPHLRARWWCLARLPDSDGLRELQPQGGQQEVGGRTGDMGGLMANPQISGRRQEPAHSGGRASRDQAQEWTAGSDTSGADVADPNVPRLEIGENLPGDHGEELSAVVGADWWATEPDVGRVAHGIPARVHRLTALGNAQVPLQAAAAYSILGGAWIPRRTTKT